MARSSVPSERRFAQPIVWGGLTVLVAAVVVQTTRTGIDILALIVAGFVLLLIERTLGDWVADTLGPVPAILSFAIVAGAGVAYMTTDTGRARARRLFSAAETQGYHTAYFSLDDGGRGRAPGGAISAAVAETLSQPLRSGAAAVRSGAASPATGTSGTRAASAGREVGSRRDSAASNPSYSGGPSTPPAGGARIARRSVSTEIGIVGQALGFRVDVSADSPGALPNVEFTVDGHSVAIVRPRADGVATAQWKTMVPGQYQVRARLTGGLVGRSMSAMLNVLPGNR
jgi:hypothetical protein